MIKGERRARSFTGRMKSGQGRVGERIGSGGELRSLHLHYCLVSIITLVVRR